MKKLFAIFSILLTCSSANAAEPMETYAEDEHGHVYRVAFDRHDRLEIDVGQTFGAQTFGTWTFGAGYRVAFGADFPDEEIWWQMRHAMGNVTATRRAEGFGVRLLLVDADYLRHDVSSWILIPGDSNLRIPGPFDIVVRWELAGATIGTSEPTDVERWEIGEFDVLLDFIRDPEYRHRLAVGATADYELLDGSRHELTPLSGATLLWGWENRRGTFAINAEARFDHFVELSSNSRATWRNRFHTNGRLEWTPIAVNDAPLAIFADAEFTAREGRENAFGVTAGVRFILPGD